MTRDVIVSLKVQKKLTDLVIYLRDEIKLSEDAASAYRERFVKFIKSFGVKVDYPLCRFKRWRTLGYRCAVFEKDWILAYEVVPGGIIVQDICHTKQLKE